MQYLAAVKSAVKGKAPIAAIPVEGHAPACIDRKRLAAWSKGVAISHIAVEVSYQFTAPRAVYDAERRVYVTPEGPHFRDAGTRHVVIEGRAGSVRTRARFNVIDRRTAVKTLSQWSEREREKLQKKVMLGALSKDQKRLLKLAKFDDRGALVPVDVALAGKRVRAYGTPVTIAEFAEFEFIVHRSVLADGSQDTDHWTVSERGCGRGAGSGKTAEAAIAHARKQARSASPERRASVRAQIIAETPASVAA